MLPTHAWDGNIIAINGKSVKGNWEFWDKSLQLVKKINIPGEVRWVILVIVSKPRKKRTTISALNVTITGNLSIEDVNNPTRNGRFKDNYTLINVSLGQFFTLDLGYDEFDAYLQLINADTGNVIASDDDGGQGLTLSWVSPPKMASII